MRVAAKLPGALYGQRAAEDDENVETRTPCRCSVVPVLTTETAFVPGRLILEIESALRPVCDLPRCLSQHYAPATWRISVRHSPTGCTPEELLICSKCRDGLHHARNAEMECALHGPLGYSVAAWWTPLGVLS